jgi:deazaflavin-dependent oxidoreductase (nitroreductase family)
MDGENTSQGGGPAEPKFGSLGWRAGNALVSGLARVGVGPIHLLTTLGSKSGRPHIVPVVPVDYDGKRWLVAPYGAVAWVHNARAAGQVTLRYGRTTQKYAIREASAEEAGPVLKRYVAIATKTRAHFTATRDSPVEDFVAEAGRHPVFELVAIGSEAT